MSGVYQATTASSFYGRVPGAMAVPPLARSPAFSARLPLMMKLVIISIFIPEGFSFFLGGLRLTLTRTLFLLLTPVVFRKMSDEISSGRYRFVASDAFVLATSLWMFIGPAVTYGIADSLQHSGPVVLEYLIAYMVTRFLLPQNGQALAFVSFLCIVICFVCLDGLFDTFSGHYVTRDLVGMVTEYPKTWHVADEFRFGLLRAAGSIEHPILFGFIASSGLLIALAVKVRWRPFCIACCALGVVICFSSAPEQNAITGIGLLIYSRLTRHWRRPFLPLVVIAMLVVAAIAFSTSTPFGHLFDLLTIDSSTAYYRLYIWSMVGPGILDNPFFAVPDTSYDYEGSVDSVWLVLALSYGMPGSILTGLSIFGACSLPVRPPRAWLMPAEARLGTVLGIITYLIVMTGFTVHYWGSSWILTGLLVGLRAHLGALGRLNKTSRT